MFTKDISTQRLSLITQFCQISSQDKGLFTASEVNFGEISSRFVKCYIVEKQILFQDNGDDITLVDTSPKKPQSPPAAKREEAATTNETGAPLGNGYNRIRKHVANYFLRSVY